MKEVLAYIGGWAITIAAVLWIMWYTNHLTGLCNKAGCIITLM